MIMKLKLCYGSDFVRGRKSAFSEYSGSEIAGGGGGESKGSVVVVGVRLDEKSKELLKWTLVNVAQSGDHVIALHVLDPTTGVCSVLHHHQHDPMPLKEAPPKRDREDQSTMLSLVKTFDSELAAFELSCIIKQIDLKLKVCRGRPVRKILSHEARSCNAASLIVGPSEIHHRIRSSVAVAKFCSRNLPRSVSVIAVDNGKILFERRASNEGLSDSQGLEVIRQTCMRSNILGKSPFSLLIATVLKTDSCRDEDTSPKTPKPRSGWRLRKGSMHSKAPYAKSSAPPRKSSSNQRILKLPSRQCSGAIYPDHKHSICDSDAHNCLKSNEESGAIEVVRSAPISLKDLDHVNILPEELEGISDKYSSMCRLFSFQELLSATSNFRPENLIGRGGSCHVFRGCLPDGRELAVKIFESSKDVLKQYVSEIQIITTLNHKNIISLVGFCLENNNLILVYDLLTRGSLEENLHGTRKSECAFGWTDRYKAAVGVAEALDHLHNASAEPIIHRDVKSSNILLSDDFEPRLTDFGLATLASNTSCDIDSFDVAGTFGYLAPEHFMHGKLDEKIDVYAFGVVLLELLSGRKPIDNGNPKGQESLVMWAKQILRGGKFSALLDPELPDLYDHGQFENMVLAARLCIRRAPSYRPKMSTVVKLLQGDSEVVKLANQQVNSSEETDDDNDEQSLKAIQSFRDLALLNLDDDSLSSSRAE